MNEKLFFKVRLYFTAIVAIAIFSLLFWNYFHRGVPSHHILNDENLPKISNWWGGFLLPLLTWFLFFSLKKRFVDIEDENQKAQRFPKKIIYAFIGALSLGILLSVFFTLGYENFPAYILLIILVSGFFFPIYRAEYFLGFVIGMTFTFGAVLPAAVGFILALIGVFLYHCIRPLILYVVSRFLFVVVSRGQKTTK
jgi:MFS family permease